MWDMTGGCLCGAVRYALDAAQTPIELCHCSRCKKAYGASFAATFWVKAATFRWLQGGDDVIGYDAPLLESPPAYRHVFCPTCGSPLPIESGSLGVVEIPAGSLDCDPGVRPLRHVHTSSAAPWDRLDDDLPQFAANVPHREHLIAALLR